MPSSIARTLFVPSLATPLNEREWRGQYTEMPKQDANGLISALPASSTTCRQHSKTGLLPQLMCPRRLPDLPLAPDTLVLPPIILEPVPRTAAQRALGACMSHQSGAVRVELSSACAL